MVRRLVVVVVVLVHLGCGTSPSSRDGEVADGRDSPEVAGVDVPDLLVPDALSAPDESGDAVTPDAAESGPLALPVEPPVPPVEKRIADGLFMQESNHTWNDQDPAVGELVALVPAPAESAVEGPLMVGPQGLYVPSDEGFALLSLPGDAPGPVRAAATAFDTVFVATETTLYQLAPGDVFEPVCQLLDGDGGVRLVGGAEVLDVLTGSEWLTLLEGQPSPGSMSPEVVPSLVLRMAEGLYVAYPGKVAWHPSGTLPPGPAAWSVDAPVGVPVALLPDRALPQPLDLVVVGTEGLVGVTIDEGQGQVVEVPLFAPERVPLSGARRAVPDGQGGFLVAAQGGAYRVSESRVGPEFRVYVPDRWMPDGEVRDVAVGPDDERAWLFATAKGPGHVSRQEWRLADKMAAMVERIVLRHDRDGAVSDSHLEVPGDLESSIPWDSDNDGGWTCYWVIAECMRYKVTGDLEAKAHFDKSLDRMLSLRTLTGTDHFLARSVIRIDGCQLDDCDDPDDGEWFLSPDGEWWVKGDTSNDEVTSHMFMMGFAHDLCADESQRQAIVDHVAGIVGGLVDNDYLLIDPQDGEKTTHGDFSPTYVNWWIEGTLADGGRRSAQMLAALNLAHYLTGDEKFLLAKEELLHEHHYHENVANLGDGEIYPLCAGSGDCDELALQAMVPLLRYESDPQLRALYRAGWNQLYSHLGPQEDALFDLTHAMLMGEGWDLSRSIRWFERYPVDLVRWVMHNGVRRDGVRPEPYYMQKDPNADYWVRTDGHIFPADERVVERHNTPQFKLSGGHGAGREMDSADVLYAWWLGRYYGFIEEENP